MAGFVRYNKVIQDILKEVVKDFETEVLHHSITAKEYWQKFFRKKFFQISSLGDSIYTEIKRVIGETSANTGQCSECVVIILENFDHFKINNPELHFPVKNLGRCTIKGYGNSGTSYDIPHYNLVTREFLNWEYHEIIVIIDNEDLVDNDSAKPLISNALIYDIGMNTSYSLKLGGFIRSLIPVSLLRAFKPETLILKIPDYLILEISHRHNGMLNGIDKWRNISNKSCKLDKGWYCC